MSKKKRKIRAEFRKGHDTRRRVGDLTRSYRQESEESHDDLAQAERVSGKGALTRKRTIVGQESVDDEASYSVQLDVDSDLCRPGRVIAVYGLSSVVHDENGAAHRCATRGLLKSISTDQRHVVAAGDQVWFLPVSQNEGIIERVEPRRGVLSRSSRGRQHVIVTNVDQLLIIASAAEPSLKPNLIDRFLVTAEKAGITPVICINKIDLVEPADLQPLIGVYGQMGYQVLVVSAETGFGMDRFQQVLKDKESVVAGQSGVGKSSLLNAVDENLELRVRAVSEENQKGRHTTTAAHLLPLTFGGYVVDTPGIRQFQLWDVIPEEVSGFFRDLRPYASLCRFPNCTHTHEDGCAVKDAVADGKLDARRYESFCYLCEGDDA